MSVFKTFTLVSLVQCTAALRSANSVLQAGEEAEPSVRDAPQDMSTVDLCDAVQDNDEEGVKTWFTEVGAYMNEHVDVGVDFFHNEVRQFVTAELKDAYLQAEELKHEEVKQILLEGQFVELYDSTTQKTQDWPLRSWPSQYAPVAKPAPPVRGLYGNFDGYFTADKTMLCTREQTFQTTPGPAGSSMSFYKCIKSILRASRQGKNAVLIPLSDVPMLMADRETKEVWEVTADGKRGEFRGKAGVAPDNNPHDLNPLQNYVGQGKRDSSTCTLL